MQKDKAIFFGVIGAFMLFLIIYTLLAYSGKGEQKAVEEEFSAPDMEIKKEAYNSRIDQLTKNKYEEPLRDNPLRYDFLEEEPEKEKMEEPKKGPEKKETRPLQTYAVEAKVSPVKRTVAHEVKSPETTKEEVIQKTEPEVKVHNPGGFGIYTATTKKSSEKSPGDNDNAYYKAYLEEDTKIINNSSLVFRLESDATIDGVFFKKQSILYGKASDNGDYFDVQITNIKSTNGKTYSISGVVVFNEYYDRGIDHAGKLNSAIREGSSESLYEETRNITGTSVERGVDIALDLADNTVKSLHKQKVNSVDLFQGYTIYIKKVQK